MAKLVFLSIALTVLFTVSNGATVAPSCGKQPNPSYHPWIVSLQELPKGHKAFYHYCIGTIISEDTIITSAHCISKDLKRIVAGAMDNTLKNLSASAIQNAQVTTAAHPIRYPGFSTNYSYSDAQANNIGVIKLAKNLTFNEFVQPACLPDNSINMNTIKDGSVFGRNFIIEAEYVSSSDGRPHNMQIQTGFNKLVQGSVPIIGGQSCAKLRPIERFDDRGNLYPHQPYRINATTMFCARLPKDGFPKTIEMTGHPKPLPLVHPENGEQIDGGGPFLINNNNRYTIVGVSNFIGSYRNNGLPGVYTGVSSYIPWIKENMKSTSG